MHQLRLLALALAVAACGSDGGSSQIDAPRGVDARVVDAPPPADAPPLDGPPLDGPPATATAKIWVVGDFATDNHREAGGFAPDATLPFNDTTPPTTRVPGGTAELFDGTASGPVNAATAFVFDAKGDKIAFVADLAAAGVFGLYIANADGTNPTQLVAGQAGVEIVSVSLSPDATKVAFVADTAAVDGGLDLFVVPASGGTPVKVSPARNAAAPTPANMDVFSQFEWSANSQYIAFSADFTEDGYDQGYVVDTNAASPTAVELLARADIATQTSGAQGVRGRLVFDATNHIYFRARVSTDNNGAFKLFQATTAGVLTPVALPPRGDTSVPDIGAFRVSPDGAQLVFSADAPTARVYNLYAVATASLTSPVNLTNLSTALATGNIAADFNTPLFFSPDGKNVGSIANFAATTATPGGMEPFVSRVDGSGTHRLTDVTCTNCDAVWMAWADNSTVFAVGDLAVNNETNLWKLDATATDATPTAAVNFVTNGDAINVISVQAP